ncbi:MAG TPA: DUF559 domain-containing protein [Pseudonocardia sp.]|jgi:hypothetical protein
MLDRPFRGSVAVAAGQLTWGELRGPRFRRVLPDVYVSEAAPTDLRTRSLAAYQLVAARGGALAGYSAAELHRVACAPVNAPAEVITGWDTRSRADLRVHRDTLRADEVRTVDGCLVTTPLRTAFDLARRLDLVEAVVAVDAFAGRFGFKPAEVLALRRPGMRGVRRLDRVITLTEPMSESAMETRLRLLLVLAGLPPPAVQHPVSGTNARVLGWLDLAYPQARLGIEYDGAVHLDPQRTVRDKRRDGAMAEVGWLVLRFTKADVLAAPDRTVLRVRRILASRTSPSSTTWLS